MLDVFKKTFSPYYRLLLAGIIVFVGLYAGLRFEPNPTISRVQVKNFSANISDAIKNGIDVNIDGEIIKLKGEDIASWTREYTRDYSGQKDTLIDMERVRDYIDSLATDIDISPVNGKFEIRDGKVDVFQNSVVGKKIDIQNSADILTNAIRNDRPAAMFSVSIIEPEITLDKINNLGINSLLGRGESNFAGSTQARIHNIKVGMNKFNGIMLKPGEEFSFNTILGNVDEAAGYEPELVIKNKTVVPEYGGGLCQVSTTLFRSAIYAGLPIIERRPHSFPVHYYNPQGFDSTIYPGVTDLRFKNDTPSYILIQNKISGTKLTFEIYGSNDSRVVKIAGPYQYDQKSTGAMKAYFTRNISYVGGTGKQERFDSIYMPPPASRLERNPLE